jgi:hypothetical protein
MSKELNLKFSDEVKEAFDEFLSDVKNNQNYEPTLNLGYGKWSDQPEYGWDFGAYDSENIKVIGPELKAEGHELLYKCGDYIIAIPQFDLIEHLEGKLLKFGNKGLELVEQNDDI